VRLPPTIVTLLAEAAPSERANQVARVLLIGVGVIVGLAAFAVIANQLGKLFGWMIQERWPVAVYAAAAMGLVITGYIFDSVVMYYGIGALILPIVVLMFMALIGF
jgi:hypothetical protein